MNESNQDDDSLLDGFFSEIENLTLQEEKGDREEESNKSKKDGRQTDSFDRKKTPQQQQKKLMVDRAESKKDNWTKFVIQEASSSSSPSPIGVTGRKPISFSMGVGTTAKKKNIGKVRSKINRRQRQENRSETTSLAFGDETPSSPPPLAQQKDQLAPLISLILPQWVAVLDTCAVLESYEAVCDMFQLARGASVGTLNSYQQHPLGVGSHTDTTTADVNFQPHFVPETLTIVVPYTVWDELDYRSKEIDDEHQRFKARRAARMLTDELRNPRLDHKTIGNPFAQFKRERETPSIRSQSRIESHRAVKEFLLLSKTSGISNDDKILACALWEQDQLTQNTVGGVVLITSDKVLTGKARADHLSVYSPLEFVEYYTKRMVSLRSRSSVPTGRRPTTKPLNQSRHA